MQKLLILKDIKIKKNEPISRHLRLRTRSIRINTEIRFQQRQLFTTWKEKVAILKFQLPRFREYIMTSHSNSYIGAIWLNFYWRQMSPPTRVKYRSYYTYE
ncbi:uncharacterized protein LOC142350563 [Convolutriloba macropyga]|uniref:uncharacterized protein LOC142350563 n=1 Tax=Convolutriloba macropyga TaxID=536237 RepID=UPI003F521577